jgi:trans-aconitate 2-methyltransferase
MRANHTIFLFLLWLVTLMMCKNLTAEKNIWEPQFYRDNSSMQHRWALRLLDKIHLPVTGKILDVGCGDGHISALIAKEKKHATLIGLDLSPSMIEYASTTFAQNLYPNLSFIVGDAATLDGQERFASIVSFSTYHRVKDHGQAFSSAYRALLPGGQFLAVFPAQMSPLLSECIAEVDSDAKWKQYIRTSDRKDYDLSDDHVKETLISVGFAHLRTGLINETESFPSRLSLRDHLRAVSSYKDILPADKEVEFFDDIINCYVRKIPVRDDGSITLDASRIEFEAIKPLIPTEGR